MEFEHSLKVHLPPAAAFERLLDLDAVAPCLPGASLGATTPDGARQGSITVEFGPMRFNYAGWLRILESHPAEGRAVLQAEGRETAGQGAATARISMTVVAQDDASLVRVETDLQVRGAIAQLGRGMIEEVSEELLAAFAECLATSVAEIQPGSGAPGASAPPPRRLNVLSLLWRIWRRRIGSLAWWRRRGPARAGDERR